MLWQLQRSLDRPARRSQQGRDPRGKCVTSPHEVLEGYVWRNAVQQLEHAYVRHVPQNIERRPVLQFHRGSVNANHFRAHHLDRQWVVLPR